MASRRMVPTKFFKDPDIMNLGSKDTQLILIGLILAADDEGREVAHAPLLGRELDYPPETIERGLQDLAANDLIVLYQVGRHRYYSLTRWKQWQTLGGRFTPSKYPASPVPTEEPSALVGESSGKFPKNPSDVGENPAQFNRSESNVTESNGDEGKEEPPSNIVFFPTVSTAPPAHNNGNADRKKEARQIAEITRQVAHILKLPASEALMRIVRDYYTHPSLSLLGEADAAREWIDDPGRNKKHKRMTPTFYRHWLQRECDARQRQEATLAAALSQQQAKGTGTAGPAQEGTTPRPSSLGLAGRNLMDLEKQYREAVQRKQPTSTQTEGEGRS
jgi:hypothetical protein